MFRSFRFDFVRHQLYVLLMIFGMSIGLCMLYGISPYWPIMLIGLGAALWLYVLWLDDHGTRGMGKFLRWVDPTINVLAIPTHIYTCAPATLSTLVVSIQRGYGWPLGTMVGRGTFDLLAAAGHWRAWKNWRESETISYEFRIHHEYRFNFESLVLAYGFAGLTWYALKTFL